MFFVWNILFLFQFHYIKDNHDLKMRRYSEIPRDISGDSLATLKISEVSKKRENNFRIIYFMRLCMSRTFTFHGNESDVVFTLQNARHEVVYLKIFIFSIPKILYPQASRQWTAIILLMIVILEPPILDIGKAQFP